MWLDNKLTPGKLTENEIQGTCSDVLKIGCYNAEKAGYAVVGSIHDEPITVVPEGTKSVEELNRVICVMPAWAKDVPLAAEGYRSKNYKKG